MSAQTIRIVGDPVLTRRADEVTDVDAALARLVDDMLTTMYDAPGIGLAAPQVGVSRRFFVFDVGLGPEVLINPVIEESEGEWPFPEGCLSIPELQFEIVRPKVVHVSGLDLDGNPIELEADELLARLIQHELDHLDGILMLEHLTDEQSNEAKRALRDLRMRQSETPKASGLSLP